MTLVALLVVMLGALFVGRAFAQTGDDDDQSSDNNGMTTDNGDMGDAMGDAGPAGLFAIQAQPAAGVAPGAAAPGVATGPPATARNKSSSSVARRMSPDDDRIRAALPAYDIGEELGRGSWGVVLAGVHRQLARAVAIKQLPREFSADPAVRRRFLAEGR